MTQQNNQLIAKNAVLLYLRMLLIMGVTLYTSRIILKYLGFEDYGIYNVVGGIVSMLAVFNGAMSAATQRFLAYEIGVGNQNKLAETFNAAVLVHIGIAFFVIIIGETIGLWFLNYKLNIPLDRVSAANWVFHFSLLSFAVSIMQVPYNAIIIAREKMNIYAYISILDVALRLLLVFALGWITFDKLKLYSILLFILSLLIASVYRIYAKNKFSETKFIICRDKHLYKTLISYSGWNLFGNIAGVSKNQGVNIVLNIFFGALINAAFGIASQVQLAFQSFIGNLQIAVNPQIIKSYASGDKQYMLNLMIFTSKISYYGLFILILPFVLEIDWILKIWLKNVPELSNKFIILILINVLIDSVSGPFMTAVQATGKIKFYQIVLGGLQILILPLTYICFKIGLPPQATFYISISISFLSLMIRLFFAKILLMFPVVDFIRDFLLMAIPLPFLIYIFTDFIRINYSHYLYSPIIVCLTSIVVSFLLIFLFGFTFKEKNFFINFLKKIVYNYKK